MIFRKAVKDDFDNIKSLYWELIDQEQGDPSFPHWKKGIHPSDEMLHNSIDKKELYVLTDGGEMTLNKFSERHAVFYRKINYVDGCEKEFNYTYAFAI